MPQSSRSRPGQRLLEIGCGWAAFAKYATENYGVSVVGVHHRAEQRETRGRALPGPAGRDPAAGTIARFRGQFDRVASFGMFEHVGRQELRTPTSGSSMIA